MNSKYLFSAALTSVLVSSAFAAQERPIKFENQVRLGYDDNIYSTNDKEGSGYLTEIVTLTSELNFSSRQDLTLYWQPEFRYRFDADPDLISYQDVYGQWNYLMSQRAQIRISDRLRYQDREGQADFNGDRSNQNYLENSLLGAVDYTVGSLSRVSVGAGYDFRIWDDEDYGQGTQNNDYSLLRLNAQFYQELKEDTTEGFVGVSYSDLEFEGDRGGYNSISIFAGADHDFSQKVDGSASVGATISDVETSGDSSDSTSPYLQAGLGYNPSEQTRISGTLGYSLSRAQNSGYNAQDQLSLGLTVGHDVTAKFNVSSSFGYIFSSYKAEYARGTQPDADSTYMTFNLRGAYQVNRNNFIDAGYQFADRRGDLTEYDRNRFDIGWRLNL